jgi:hypothetical protein
MADITVISSRDGRGFYLHEPGQVRQRFETRGCESHTHEVVMTDDKFVLVKKGGLDMEFTEISRTEVPETTQVAQILYNHQIGEWHQLDMVREVLADTAGAK